MQPETKVTVYYGPLAWFDATVAEQEEEGILEAASELDERRKEFRIVGFPGDNEQQEDEQFDRPQRLIAKSGDYASLSEHVISNFPGLIQALRPLEVHLHNPPEQIRTHLERAFRSSFEVETFAYATVTSKELRSFRDGFEGHLVGQERVRDIMLSALYPLTRSRHNKPVVVMFYGPSGVGKTETAKFISELLGGKLMRKQFSMYQNEQFGSYIFGGKHSEGSFAHDLLDRESGVILIDEFDKAASVFHSAFYEFFDGGVFEDRNYRVDVGRSLIICTSNYDSEDEIHKALGDALFSRFDALIKFEQLDAEQILTVADRLAERKFASLDDDEKAILEEDFLKEHARVMAQGSTNIRKLGKSVDELISILLVERLLESELEE
ncbi:AAA family ATPase [Leucobacter sp. GX0328]